MGTVRGRNGRTRFSAASIALLVVAGAACSSRVIPVDSAVRTDPPSWLAQYAAGAAAGGAEVVVLGDGEDDEPPQIRLADGTWRDLVAVPDRGSFVAMSLGDTVVAWGTKCVGECLDGGDQAMFMLSDDRTEWDPLDVPGIRVDSETEVFPLPSAGGRLVMSVGGESFEVDRSGRVRSVPGWPLGTSSLCLTEAGLVALSADAAEWRAPITSVEVLDLDDVDSGWRVATAPPSDMASYYGDLCGPTSVLVFDKATSTEWRYLPLEDRWTSVPSNYWEAAGEDQLPSAWHAQMSWAPDGRTIVGSPAAGVLVRTDDGTWTATGLPQGTVIATSDTVFVSTRGSPDLVQVWPPS